MTNAYFYSNIASPTTLSGNINNSVTSATVAATTGWPSSTPYIVALDYGTSNEELVKVTSNAAGTLTIVRGFGGTSAVSHSTGATVRHVLNAQDLTDFRTHEQSTAAVHGIAGSFVGTTDVQTLTNKTLTGPTVNAGNYASGGTLAGTFSGTPTFSGALTFTGGPTVNTLSMLITRTNTTDPALRVRLDADTQSRLITQADGTLVWGSGSATGDVNLYRSAANVLKTDDALAVVGEIQSSQLIRSARTLSSDSLIEGRQIGDANARWFVREDGMTWWGPGSAVQDTNLYRSGVGQLKTDQSLQVVGTLQAGNIYTGPQDPWTPTWSTTTGLHLPSFGNATVNGTFSKVGRMVFFQLRIVFGSTTNFGSSAGSGDNWTFSLPQQAARTSDAIGWYAGKPASSKAQMGYLSVVSTDATVMQLNMGTAILDGTATANTGVVDSISPYVWASGDILVMSGFYEANS